MESSETFTAYATIDAGYYMLQDLYAAMQKDTPKNGVEAAIDHATGYNKTKDEYYKKQTIVILEDVIAAKKVVGADYAGDEAALNKVRGL